MIRAATFGIACAMFLASVQPAAACATLTPEGQRRQAEIERRWLNEHSDTVVTGVWQTDSAREESDDDVLLGPVMVGSGNSRQWYRFAIPGDINCGFPFLNLEDGDTGRFYLQRRLGNEDDNGDDYIDDYDFVHFERAGTRK